MLRMTFTDRMSPWRRRPDRELLKPLVCPFCRGELEWTAEAVHCADCRHGFPVVSGIPVFANPAADNSPGAAHKREQMKHFDGARAEFEIERPHDTTWLYQWLMDEKLRRATGAIAAYLPDSMTLTVCGGSGMEAEYLARAGALVIMSDISFGAALRARERARRYNLNLVAIVADAERLPIANGGVGIAFVHDGLHHLNDPRVGLSEMARVASIAVSITEPARAAATAVAVRLRLAENYEEAGNRVERLDSQDVAQRLEASGYCVLRNERYAMYYQHQPGRLSRILSQPTVLFILRMAFPVVNRFIGGIGNKLTIQAVRNERSEAVGDPPRVHRLPPGRRPQRQALGRALTRRIGRSSNMRHASDPSHRATRGA